MSTQDQPLWSPCDSGGCVQTATDNGFVLVRSSLRPDEVARFTEEEWAAFAGRLLPPGGETQEDIEVWTAGVRYPCSDMGRAWRKFGELKAEGRPDVKIVKRTVVTGPWREVSE